MSPALPLILSLIFGAQFAARPGPRVGSQPSARVPAGASGVRAQSDTPGARTPEGPGAEGAAPPEFRGVDFGNFTYPFGRAAGAVRLRAGSYERPDPSGGGVTVELRGVGYADLTGDGRREALVTLHAVSCGGSCDGGSHLFYLYAGGRRKPSLVWRIETGSLAYGCGLKSLAVRGRRVTLEVFGDCRLDGETFAREYNGEAPWKFGAKEYTRFAFESAGPGVVLRGREVFPYPRGEVKNYQPELSIGDE